MKTITRYPLMPAAAFVLAATAMLSAPIVARAQAPSATPAPAAPASKYVVKEKDAPVVAVALWMENGKPMVLRGADVKNAPATATLLHSTIYNLDGPMYRRVSIPKGARFSPPSNTADTILYILKGRLSVKLGDDPAVVAGPNDAFRERAGVLTQFHALEATEMIETSIPAQMPK